MATWREWLIAAAIAALLILVAYQVGEEKRILCEHLVVPRQLVYEESDTVNRMLEICGIENVRVKSMDEALKRQRSLSLEAKARKRGALPNRECSPLCAKPALGVVLRRCRS